jgi:ribonuclease G
MFLFVDEVVAPGGLKDTSRRDIRSLLKAGQQIVVQVVKDAMGTKGARVTMEITLAGRFVVFMPFSEFVGVSKKLPDDERTRLHELVGPLIPPKMGAIVRTAARGASKDDLARDLEFLQHRWDRVSEAVATATVPGLLHAEMDLALRMARDVFSEAFGSMLIDDQAAFDEVVTFLGKTSPDLARRVLLYWEDAPLFEAHGLAVAIDSALRRRVVLPSGGCITIDKTEALTAIDVDTGHFVGGKNLEQTLLRTNLEAADEIARQLRLRDVGGIIIVDFIDMEDPEHREELLERLGVALQRDRTRTRVSEMSRLGLVEITRKNVADGLRDLLTEPCPLCGGEGRVITQATDGQERSTARYPPNAAGR